MKRATLFAAISAGLIASFFAGKLLSQQPTEASAPKDDMMTKMMEECMKHGTPGAEHKQLDALAGKWNLSLKFWMLPGSPEQTSTATSERTWILGGRFLEEKVSSEFQGQPFEGRGIFGFDNYKKTYINYWFDNMATSCLQTTGTSADGKTITLTGKFANPMANWKDQDFKQTYEISGNNKHVYTMYMPAPDGTLYKHMEITYTKK